MSFYDIKKEESFKIIDMTKENEIKNENEEENKITIFRMMRHKDKNLEEISKFIIKDDEYFVSFLIFIRMIDFLNQEENYQDSFENLKKIIEKNDEKIFELLENRLNEFKNDEKFKNIFNFKMRKNMKFDYLSSIILNIDKIDLRLFYQILDPNL